MDAVHKRRQYIIWEKSIEEEKKRIEFLKQMKQETMRCNVISQRIALQEFLADRQEDITAELEAWASADAEKLNQLTRETVEQLFDTWLAEFNLVQPSQFFKDHPTNDSELVCSIQTEKEFLLTTLEFFGLPKNYMSGNGHFPDWGKEKKEDKAAAARKKKQQQKTGGKTSKKLEQLKAKRGLNKTEENKKPTHFDISVFTKCYKRFVACTGEVRSATRKRLLKDMNRTMKVFLDPFKEISFKKVVDVHELASLLVKEGMDLDPVIIENLGSILLCFGDIEFEPKYGDRIPPDTEDEKRQKMAAEQLLLKYEEAKK